MVIVFRLSRCAGSLLSPGGISSFSWRDLLFSMAGSLIFHGGNLELGSLIKGIGKVDLGPSYTTMSPARPEGGTVR